VGSTALLMPTIIEWCKWQWQLLPSFWIENLTCA